MLMSFVSVFASADEISFSDVKTTRWSYNNIMYAVKNGYMTGVGEGKFNPSGNMSRAMVVTVLHRMEGTPASTAKNTFSDVKNGQWYTDAIIWASQKNIVNGVGDRKFDPNGNVTREQLAAMICRYARYRNVITDSKNDITSFSDYKSVSSWARADLAWANESGLITGMTETTLGPKGFASREQFAAILERFKTNEDSYKYALVYNAPTVHSEFTEKEYPLVKDADVYVSADGNDNNDGSFGKPVRSFEKAKELVREIKKTASKEIVVAFMAGDYGYLDRVIFTSEDSGSEEAPIRYCAYGDGDVVFSNSAVIPNADFKPIDSSDYYMFPEKNRDAIYKVDLKKYIPDTSLISDSSDLYYDGDRNYVARFPNLKAGEENQLSFTYNGGIGKVEGKTVKFITSLANRVNKYHTLEGVKAAGYFSIDYIYEIFDIVNYNPENQTFELLGINYQNEEPENAINPNPSSTQRTISEDGRDFETFIFNISEELDSDGEYFIDKDTYTLYVYNPGDGEYRFTYGDTGEEYKDTRTYRDINFKTKINHADYIYIDGADYLTFDNFRFMYNVGGAVRGYCSNVTVKNCLVRGTGKFAAYAIELDGYNNKVLSNELCQLAGGGVSVKGGDRMTLTPSGCVIDNNYIHHLAFVHRTYKPAVYAGGVDIKITHNELAYGAHSAVIFYGNDIMVEYNILHDYCDYLADGGLVYTGRDVTKCGCSISFNIFCNVGVGPGANPFGIYLDDGVSGETVRCNIFFDVRSHGLVCSGARNNISNNVFIKTHGSPVWAFAKYYDMAVDSTPMQSGNFKSLFQKLQNTPYKSEIWLQKYPYFADLSEDYLDYDNPKSVVCTSDNIIRNNFAVDCNLEFDIVEPVVRFGTVSNNQVIGKDVNPGFKNPALGDYTYVGDAANFEPIPVSEIGRY